MEFHKIWVEQCEAAENIEGQFGTERALEYLIGEKFLNFLDAAETDPAFKAEIPNFVAEIHNQFDRWKIAEYLDRARQTPPPDASIDDDDDPEDIEIERQAEIRKSARDLLRAIASNPSVE